MTERVKVEVLSAEAIRDQRKRLIESTRMSLEELEAKAANYALTPHEQGTLDRIRDLDYISAGRHGHDSNSAGEGI